MASSSESTQDVTMNMKPAQVLSDPNERKNRVPTDDELQGLRTLMASNSHIDEFLDKQIFQLRTSRQTLSTRFNQQQRDLEATQSQLCETDKLLNALQKQKLDVKQRMDDLKGLANPLRRFPVELLRTIFELAVTTSYPGIWEAFKISSVCQLWRDVALDAPRLWPTVVIRPFVGSVAFWAHLRPRMKFNPVEIRIKNVSDVHLERLLHWKLPELANLQALTVEQSPPLTAYGALDAIFGGSYIPLVELHIFIYGRPGIPNGEVSYSGLADRFPSLARLYLKSINPTSFQPSPSSNLSTLSLQGIHGLNLDSLFQCFQSLEALTLRSVEWVDPQVQTVTPPSKLKKLVLFSTPTFPDNWNGNFQFPSLESLYYNGLPTGAFKTFVVSHPTLKDLDCITENDDLKLYAPALPNLVRIVVSSSFDAITNWRTAGLSAPPFPSLKVLGICGDDYTLSELEDLVRARCLPIGHPFSRLEHPSLLVELGVEARSSGLEEPFWSQNELLQSASQEVIPYPEEEDSLFVILRWH